LTWEEDEPTTAVAREETASPAEESAPTPQAESEAAVVEAIFPEANIVEGEYFAQMQVTPKSCRNRQVWLIQFSFC
jgi:hypothetical protein